MNIWVLIIPPAVAIFAVLVIWFFYGRDPHETVPVIVAPPKDMGILECGVLIDDAVNTKDIAMALYDLRLKGYLIEQTPNVYVINPKLSKSDFEALTLSQQLLIESLINRPEPLFLNQDSYYDDYVKNKDQMQEEPSSSGMDFLHKEYLKRLSKKLKYLKIDLYDLLTFEGYYPLSPFAQRKPFIHVGSILFAIPIFSFFYAYWESRYLLPLDLIIGISISGLIVAYSSFLFERKTLKGRKAKAMFLGFKQYIVTAEKDRIRFVIENNLEEYKSILPYAAIFGVIDKWIEPMSELDAGLRSPEFLDLDNVVTALDVDVSITEKNRLLRSLRDLFYYGIGIVHLDE